MNERITNLNNCAQMREYLDLYLDNQLDPETHRRVAQHLSQCTSCDEALSQRQRVKGLLKKSVGNQSVPNDLQSKIQERIRKSQTPNNVVPLRRVMSAPRWLLAAAAALVMVAGSWGALRWWSAKMPPAPHLSGAAVLQIGVQDHVHCAIVSGLANRQFTDEQMTARLGADYAGLVPLIRSRVPQAQQIIVGHRCKVNGREMIHLILKNQEQALSLVITKKTGETFDRAGLAAVIEEAGVPIYRANLDNLEVAGFETRDHLAFVVSGLETNENLSLMAALALPVRDYLAGLEA